MELFLYQESYTAGGIIRVSCSVIYWRIKKNRIQRYPYIVSLRVGDFLCTKSGGVLVKSTSGLQPQGMWSVLQFVEKVNENIDKGS